MLKKNEKGSLRERSGVKKSRDFQKEFAQKTA